MKTSLLIAGTFWLLLLLEILLADQFEWSRSEAYNTLSLLLFAGIIFGWFLADTRERDISTGIGLRIAVVAIAIVAVPYYKFRYLGARAGFRFVGIILLNVGLLVLVPAIVEFLMAGRIGAH